MTLSLLKFSETLRRGGNSEKVQTIFLPSQTLWSRIDSAKPSQYYTVGSYEVYFTDSFVNYSMSTDVTSTSSNYENLWSELGWNPGHVFYLVKATSKFKWSYQTWMMINTVKTETSPKVVPESVYTTSRLTSIGDGMLFHSWAELKEFIVVEIPEAGQTYL